MIKKLPLFCLALFSSVLLTAQTNTKQPLVPCGNQAPPQQWEDWMSKEVEKFKERVSANKTQLVNYTIPVVVHVIHFGEAVGTYPNIDSNQIMSQIRVLGHDFEGTGLNANKVPAVFANSVAGNTGIKFCMAYKNPSGATLAERGIDRIDASAQSWDNPNTPTLNIQSYINTVIMPNTWWDPTKYFNIWISDRPPASTLNGFGTYPPGTSLNGLYGGGMNIGTATNDGIWVWTKAFGTVGSLQSPYDKGRTATHETGHYLGLRHTWGDGNCLSDFAGDTPWSKAAHVGAWSHPVHIDRCGVNQAPNGEMFMNHMDVANDTSSIMFTIEQSIRMLTAMSQSPQRNLLGTHGLCEAYAAPSSSAIASFSLNGSACVGKPFTPMNTSNGFPDPTYIWSSSPPAAFNPGPSVANPAITFNSPGTYTLTLVATNTVANSSYTMAVTVSTCVTAPVCIDSLRMIKSSDTLVSFNAANSTNIASCMTGFAGYMTGTNCYQDKEFAQYYPPSTYSNTQYPQVNSVIVLFDSLGTKIGANPGTKINCKIYGGSVNYGPVGALAVKSDSLKRILLTPHTKNITYLGTPTYTFALRRVIPYKFDFGPPAIINSPGQGFFVGVEVPMITPGDSIRLYHNTKYNNTTNVNDSSAWALTFNNLWKPLRSYRNARVQLAIMPIITCSPIMTNINELTPFTSNIAVVPNPNNGVFDLIFTLPKEEQNLYVRIFNAVGQQISMNHVQNVSNNVITIDMNDRPDGIYFTEITNGTERVVKKIVISH